MSVTIDYFQCKRYQHPPYDVLKKELDGISAHVASGKIKQPRRLFFVLSSAATPSTKDKVKRYATESGLPMPVFWEPIILDKKIKANPRALENFFGFIDEEDKEQPPQVDTTGLIIYSTHETRFTVVNNGGTRAVDCSWFLKGFGFPDYQVEPTVFNLEPGQQKEVIIALSGQFMGQNPIKELRLHFRFRDSKNEWYYSERYLMPELAPSEAFYRIAAVPGSYTPARPLQTPFIIDSVDRLDHTGLNESRLVSCTVYNVSKTLKINIGTTFCVVCQFNVGELETAFRELSERKIAQMIKTGRIEEEFNVTTNLRSTSRTGFEAYKEVRDSI